MFKFFSALLGFVLREEGNTTLKKKVLIITQCFYPEIGSAGNRMKNIFKLLSENGYSVDVITTEPSYPNKMIYEDGKFWDDEELNRNARSVIRITVKNRKYSQSIINRLYYYLEMMFKMIFYILRDKNKYDIVFASSPPIFIGFIGLVSKKQYNSKLILDVRDLWPESLKGVDVFNYRLIFWVFNYLEKLLYQKSDEIIVNSYEFLQHITLKSNVPATKIGFMPNSAMNSELTDILNPINSDFKVIYTGNIGLAQDVDILKDLSKMLSKHNISLSIVGYGMKKNDLINYVKKEKLTNVQFFAPMTRKECFELNKKHHVGFVSLNDKEVFNTVLPGKIVDYLTCGLPIVASVSGYAKEIIEKENTGYVSEKRDVKEILDFILKLKKNPEIRHKFGLNGQKYVREKFQWQVNIHQLVNKIEDC